MNISSDDIRIMAGLRARRTLSFTLDDLMQLITECALTLETLECDVDDVEEIMRTSLRIARHIERWRQP